MVDGCSMFDSSSINPQTDFACISPTQEIVTLKMYYSSTALGASNSVYLIQTLKASDKVTIKSVFIHWLKDVLLNSSAYLRGGVPPHITISTELSW